IDLDQGTERWMSVKLDIIDRQDQPILRIIGQLIRTGGIGYAAYSFREALADGRGRIGPEIETKHTARSVGDKEPRERGHDAVWTCTIVRTGHGWVAVAGTTGGKAGKPRVRAGRPDLCEDRSGGEGLHGKVGPIGEIVDSGRLVDVTDIERI